MPDLFQNVTDFIQGLARGNPLLGVFLASLVGNMIPFFPVPYFLVVVFVTTTFKGLSLIQVATISALGAAMGKFVSYGLGYGASVAFSTSRARFDSFRKILGGSAFLAAFIFAASPFPDDVIFIPLGMMRYSPPKTFIALFSGKFALTLLVAYLARSSTGFLDLLLGGSSVATAVSAVVVVLIALIMTRVDWEKVLSRSHDGIIRRTLRRVKNSLRGPRPPRKGSEEPVTASEDSSPSS